MKKLKKKNKSPTRFYQPANNAVPVTIRTRNPLNPKKITASENSITPKHHNSIRQWYRVKKEENQLAKLQKQKKREQEKLEKEAQRLKEQELAEILYKKERLKQALIAGRDYEEFAIENLGHRRSKKESRREKKRRLEIGRLKETLLSQEQNGLQWSDVEDKRYRNVKKHKSVKRSCKTKDEPIFYKKRKSVMESLSKKMQNCFYRLCCQFYCWLTIILSLIFVLLIVI